MPGMTTPFNLRYPLLGEVVTAQSWQDLATDIDSALSTLDAARVALYNPPTAGIGEGGPVAGVAVTVTTTLTFDTEEWDNAGLANLGVNNDRLSLTNGVWYVTASCTLDSGSFTTLTSYRLTVFTGATVWGGQMTDTITAGDPHNQVGALVVVTSSPTALQAAIRWTGTGGPATFSFAALTAVKLRDL